MRSAAGFTLVELLVGFALLGLIATMSLGALQFGTRVWERTAVEGEAGARLQLVQDLLRRQLGRAVARIRSQPDPAAKLFRGRSEAASFVAPLPGQAAAGGLYDQRLYLNGERLLLAWRPYHETEAGADRGAAVLLEGVTALSFAYLDPAASRLGSSWATEWDQRDLPRLVRLRIDFADPTRAAWPELLIRLPLAKRRES